MVAKQLPKYNYIFNEFIHCELSRNMYISLIKPGNKILLKKTNR